MSKQLSHSIDLTTLNTTIDVLALFNSISSVSWKHSDPRVLYPVSISFVCIDHRMAVDDFGTRWITSGD
jgi:hypothetical protein